VIESELTGAKTEEQVVSFSKDQCIPPTPENSRSSAAVEKMFNSHYWRLLRAEAQNGGNGVLIRMYCERCGANKIAILEENGA
jgi:hypothetical protein